MLAIKDKENQNEGIQRRLGFKKAHENKQAIWESVRKSTILDIK